MSKPIIGVSYPGVSERHMGPIKEAAEKYGYNVKFGVAAWYAESGKGVTDDWYDDCDIIFGYPDPPKVASYKSLKWLQSDAAGIEEILKLGKLPSETLFTNSAGAYGSTISEYVMTQLLMIYKKSIPYYEQQKESNWNDLGRIKDVEGSVVTIVGFGDLGKNIARRLHAFGAIVRAVKRTVSDKPDYIEKIYTTEDIDQALEGADVTILCLPDTPETENMLNRDRIFALKQGSVVINVARASVWDQDAIADALKEGHLYGVAADVASPEPLPEDSPFWNTPNLILTPHISGGLCSEKNIDRVIDIFLTNLEAYACGTPMIHVVNQNEGY